MLSLANLIRRYAVLTLAFGLWIGSLPALPAAGDIEIHVDPAGDDTADGSPARPLGSLTGARDAVRRAHADGDTRLVRVVVEDGVYRVAEPLVLTPEDSGTAEAPVRYEAAPGARPVFSGGRKITGFQPFDYSQAGVCGDAAWIALAKKSPNSN